MKEFFKNQYVTGIIIGFVIAILIEYIFPILPDGNILWKYFLDFLLITFRYVLPIIGLWFLYKYRPLNKRFVLEVALFFSLLLFAILTDIIYSTTRTTDKVTSNHYDKINQLEKTTNEQINNLYHFDKDIIETIDKINSKLKQDLDFDFNSMKIDSEILDIIKSLITKIDSLETIRK